MSIGEADSMTGQLVDVKIERHMVLAEHGGKHHGILDRDALVLIGVPDKTWWSLRSHLQFIGKQLDELGGRVFAQQIIFRALMSEFAHCNHRIAKNSQIRTRTL